MDAIRGNNFIFVDEDKLYIVSCTENFKLGDIVLVSHDGKYKVKEYQDISEKVIGKVKLFCA